MLSAGSTRPPRHKLTQHTVRYTEVDQLGLKAYSRTEPLRNLAQIPRAKSQDFLSQRLSSQKDPGCGPI